MEEKAEKEEKSRLEVLLEKNAYGEGLTQKEKVEAYRLIWAGKAENKDKYCWVCGTKNSIPSIYDTGLCQGHALYALATRK
jgi:hypothetical protein